MVGSGGLQDKRNNRLTTKTNTALPEVKTVVAPQVQINYHSIETKSVSQCVT